MKEYCRYMVLDMSIERERNCSVLIVGEKWKDFSKGRYVKCGSFRSFGIFGRKITECYSCENIMGRDCIIVYWKNSKPRKNPHSVVYRSGRRLNLQGDNYVDIDVPCGSWIWLYKKYNGIV